MKDTFSCTFVGDLGRETPRSEEDTSNFNDRFITWDKTLSPNSVVSLEVTDTAVVVTRFKLRTSDSGTSLNVYLHLPPEKTSEVRVFDLEVSPLYDMFPCLCVCV